jgi:hypothetical protein
MAEAVELLESTVRDPEATRASFTEGAVEVEVPAFLAALSVLAQKAEERPVPGYRVLKTPHGLLFANPPVDAAQADVAWQKAWPGDKPPLVSLDAEFDLGLFQGADRWLAVLRRHPAAFDNLSILDDLVLMAAPLAEGPIPPLATGLVEPLLRRALSVIRASLAGTEGSALDWRHLENRPVLRLLTREARRLDHAGRPDEAAVMYEWLLRLNPNDNHGHRDWMVNHYLRGGADQQALDLAERYPGDFLVPTLFGRALALWRLGRRAEAEEALRAAAADRPRVVQALLAGEMPRPEPEFYGVTVGGEEEAWLYREDMRAVWLEAPEAMEFLRALPVPKPPPPGRGAGKGRGRRRA